MAIRYEKLTLDNYLKNRTINSNDLFIVLFENSLKTDYLLIYKNFTNHISAFEYCEKYVKFVSKCIILNVKNLN